MKTMTVKLGERSTPPATGDLRAFVLAKFDAFLASCEKWETNPDSQAFGLFLAEQDNLFDATASDFGA